MQIQQHFTHKVLDSSVTWASSYDQRGFQPEALVGNGSEQNPHVGLSGCGVRQQGDAEVVRNNLHRMRKGKRLTQ